MKYLKGKLLRLPYTMMAAAASRQKRSNRYQHKIKWFIAFTSTTKKNDILTEAISSISWSHLSGGSQSVFRRVGQ